MSTRATSQPGAEPVYVTGLGMVCSVGGTASSAWTALAAGQPGITPISCFDPDGFATQVAAQIPETFLPTQDQRSSGRRSWSLLRTAVAEAVAGRDLSPCRTGLAIGVNANYLPLADIARHARHRNGQALDFDSLAKTWPDLDSRLARRHGDSIVAQIARQYGLTGPAAAVDTACSSGLYAIGEAMSYIRRGAADCMIAGGAYSVNNPIGILAFEVLGALSRQTGPALASRPFDRDRDGFVMGEAAAVLVLESAASVHARGAAPLARAAGIGLSLGGATLTAPSEGGKQEAAAMRQAIEAAGWTAGVVDAVFAHGTSTPLNDVMEAQAIREVLGAKAGNVAVTSNKGQIGHTVCAAGACSAVFAVQALAAQHVPPTVGLRNPDPACDLDIVRDSARALRLRHLLVNSFGFGGQNACLALAAV